MNTNRQPKGSPIGGQFAPGSRDESSSVGLGFGPNSVQMHTYVTDLDDQESPDMAVEDISHLVDDEAFEYTEVQVSNQHGHATIVSSSMYEGEGVNPDLLNNHGDAIARVIGQRFDGVDAEASSGTTRPVIDQVEVKVTVPLDMADTVGDAIRSLRDEPGFRDYGRAASDPDEVSVADGLRRDLNAWGIDPDAPNMPDELAPNWESDDFKAVLERQPHREPMPYTSVDASDCDPAHAEANEVAAAAANNLTFVGKREDGTTLYSHEEHGYVPVRWPKQYENQTREQEAERVNGAIQRGMNAHNRDAERAVTNAQRSGVCLAGTAAYMTPESGRPMQGPAEMDYETVQDASYVARVVDDYGHEFYRPITHDDYFAQWR